MTEREWQRLQNSMQFVIEQQVNFEVNLARIEANFDQANDRFIQSEKRLDRLGHLGERMMKAADQRFKRSEPRLDPLEENLDRLEKTSRGCKKRSGTSSSCCGPSGAGEATPSSVT
jgi:hypothetical protein